MDSTLKNNDVEVKTTTQNSEKSQHNMFNSNQSMQVLSIDVGCVATGYSHLDLRRAPSFDEVIKKLNSYDPSDG
ncbi:unnamed protein product [Rotaria socialis]